MGLQPFTMSNNFRSDMQRQSHRVKMRQRLTAVYDCSPLQEYTK